MEGDMVTMDTSEQQWKHLMRRELSTEGSIYNTGAIFFRQDYREEPLNLISYTDFGAPESDQQNSECSIFFNPDLVSLENNASNSSNKNEPSVFSPGNLSPSSLNLSMAMATGNTVDEEMASQPVKFSDVGCDIPELKGDNFKKWKEKVLLHLGWMDIDYAMRKNEPPVVTNTSTEAEIALYEHWERSNRVSVMFIKTKISAGIRGSVDQHTKVHDLLKAIDE
ncbi:hypothetical protein F0562_030632 [Nyssa sinensis]|uniref:Uncharacterized protein n=1 Tax=Nyssa sinensis TaxID=561372 RepID=A0A5J5AZ26_9ASTE|nr:hypothetical protein F0562_030632 [Nyssa sinensis]